MSVETEALASSTGKKTTSRCVECGDPFPYNGKGRPFLRCPDCRILQSTTLLANNHQPDCSALTSDSRFGRRLIEGFRMLRGMDDTMGRDEQ